MHKYLQSALRLSQTVIPSVPKWFIPLYDIEVECRNTWSTEATIQHGFWSGSLVVVESVAASECTHFSRNVDLQFSLNYPHLLNLLRAFHLGNQRFIVYHSYISMADYLSSTISSTSGSINEPVFRQRIWQKFHQVALALKYLYEQGIAHGTLRSRHLVVDKEGAAQLMFLSADVLRKGFFMISDSQCWKSWRNLNQSAKLRSQSQQASPIPKR